MGDLIRRRHEHFLIKKNSINLEDKNYKYVTILSKLRPLGLMNQIIDHSDFKLSKFERQFRSDLNLTIKIGLRSRGDVNF